MAQFLDACKYNAKMLKDVAAVTAVYTWQRPYLYLVIKNSRSW